jgi:type IV secretory pathway ATPase VirB11/archaellum biosynthesis ATPase
MALKDLVYFKEKENFEGKKDNTLILDCYNCPQKEKFLFKSNICIDCLLNTIFTHKDRKFSYISILWNDVLIKDDQFNSILEYYTILKKIRKINEKIEKIRTQKCKFKEFKCKIFPEFSSLYKINDNKFYDPILVYNLVAKRSSILENKKSVDSICENCHSLIRTLVNDLLRLLNNLKIIQKFKNYQRNNENRKKYYNFYEYLFLGNFFYLNSTQKIHTKNLGKTERLLKTYNIGKYGIFRAQIYENSYEIEKKYIVNYFYKGEPEEDYFEKIIQDIHQNIKIAEFDQLVPLERLIKMYRIESIKHLNFKYEFSELIQKKIGFITALKKLNLDKLFPLLIDDFIEEIFLDSPKDEIYVNHQSYARCRTGIKLTLKEIDRIKTLLRLYSGERLDYMNPIIKFVMKNKYFYCRFALDVEPIQINNFALDIRKLNKNILTVQDLLKNGTLDPLMASFLYFNILRRKNITVTGETDTGKTTLINALDLLTPKEFRKIYIENITESLNQFEYGKHQLKYKVDSLEESIVEKYSKSNQIKTLLHRTPDIIFLGEILTKEETEAMFHCLAAGLRGFQTIHSKNIDSLLNRFIYHFKINRSCLNDLDLIILMKKDFNERKVVGMYEIRKSPDNQNKNYNSIFEYDPGTKKWLLSKSFYETNVILELKKYENLSNERLSEYINIYNEIFDFFLKINRIDNFELIDFFHKISYHSVTSIKSLKDFWNNWKNNRSLNF